MEQINNQTNEGTESYFSDDALKLFVKDINRYPLLSKEETLELFKQYKNGDETAKDILVNSNLKLVMSIAGNYIKKVSNLEFLDLIQEGTLGLMRALETYVPEEGALSTYATWWIKQSIGRAINQKEDFIKKPDYMRIKVTKYMAYLNKCEKEFITVTDNDLCKLLDVKIDQLQTIKETANLKILSSNQKVNEDDESSELEEFLFVEDKIYDNILDDIVNRNLFATIKNVLTPINYYVLYYRVITDETVSLDGIASSFKITRERVRQLEVDALKRVKPYFIKDHILARRKLKEVALKYGNKIDKVRLVPVDPLIIVKYKYMEDELESIEKELFYLKYFADLEYSNEEIAKELGLTKFQLANLLKKLENKTKIIFEDVNKFKEFEEQFLEQIGTKIFNLIDEKNFRNINYLKINEEINNFTYCDFEKQYRYFLYYLEEIELDLLRRYFDGYPLKGYDNDYLEKEIEKTLKVKFNLAMMTRKDIFILLTKYGNCLADEIRIELTLKYGIKGKSIMSASEINQVYCLLNKMNTEKKFTDLRLSKAFI